jgi:hypothetical protein
MGNALAATYFFPHLERKKRQIPFLLTITLLHVWMRIVLPLTTHLAAL